VGARIDSVLDDLIDRFGTGAVVTAQPAMLESGETYRWELKIDGEFVRGVYAKLRGNPAHPDTRLLMMVSDGDEVELGRWSTKRPEPATFTQTLGGLRRHHDAT
jgi:hypothetical protein